MRKIKKHFGLSLSRYKTFKAMMSVSVIVFLICATLSIFFFNKLSKELKNNFQETNQYMVSILQNQFQNTLNYSTSIILDPLNQKIISDEFDENDIYNFSTRLTSYTTTSAILDTIFIYYPDIDLVVCNFGVYNLKQYYLIEYGYEKKDSFENWKNTILKAKGGFSYDSIDDSIITYTRLSSSSDTKKNLNHKQIIIFNFNMSDINIQDNNSVIDEFGFYVDNHLVLIKHSNEDFISSYIKDNSLIENVNNVERVGESFIYVNPFDFTNMYLIARIDISSYRSSMAFLIFAAILTLLISFVFSIVFSLKQSERLFKPFRELANKLSPTKYQKDSLQIINEKIDSLLEEETYKDERLKVNYESLQLMFLLNLLNTKYSDKYCTYMLNKKDIVFSYSSFYIFTCDDKEVNQLINTSKDELFLDIPCQFFIGETESLLIGFINLEEDKMNQTKIIEEITDLLEVNSFDCNKVNFKLSDLCISINDIYFGYKQCQYLLNKGKGVDFFVDNTKSIIKDLKSAFENNDVKLYNKCLDIVFANNKYLPSYLLNDFVKELKQYAHDFNFDPSSNKKVSKELFFNLVKGNRDVSETQRNLIEKVNNIIDESFTNPNLGLYFISDQLNVSNTYLSTIYKENCGIGIVQKINQKRVEYAKSLLLNTDKSVKDVALSAGFTSDISFIRVFKKSEDLTPGKLRKKHK